MLIVSVFVAVGMTLALAALGSRSILLAILTPVTTLVLLEALYRGALLTAYGRHYRFSYPPFLFQDHGRYGNALRPSTRVRDVRFLLFDKYVFNSLPAPLSSVEENIAARFDVNINSNGYRGPELRIVKRAPLLIFCSGGSTTACYGDDEQTWPSQPQLALARKGLEVEVVNGGVWGWTSTQELKRLRDEAAKLQPDVVLLHQGWNE